MPIIEKEATEEELRARIARLDSVMSKNPAMVKALSAQKQATQRELNLLLLSQPGYEVVKTNSTRN